MWFFEPYSDNDCGGVCMWKKFASKENREINVICFNCLYLLKLQNKVVA